MWREVFNLFFTSLFYILTIVKGCKESEDKFLGSHPPKPSGKWAYKENLPGLYGPTSWGNLNPSCSGQRQSPINIVTKDAVLSKNFTPIYTQLPASSAETTYTNDGHGFSAKVEFKNKFSPIITGGPLGSDRYTFHDFHIHWPSEHTIDGNCFPAELHVIHFNLKYGSFEIAVTQPDGVAVVAVFFELDNAMRRPRPNFAATAFIRDYNSNPYSQTTKYFPLLEFYKIYKRLNFYSYLGSFTAPNCSEVVTWLVSKDPITIYRFELDLLTIMKDNQNELISFNNRPVQNLNGRIVSKNFL